MFDYTIEQNTAARGRTALQAIAFRALLSKTYNDDIDGRAALKKDAYAVGWEAAVARLCSPLRPIDAWDLGAQHAHAALRGKIVSTDNADWFTTEFAWQFECGYTDCCQ